MKFNFTFFPTLITDRLTLKEVTFIDAQSIFELRSSEEINKFVATKRMQNLDDAKDFITTCNNLYQKENRIFWLIEFESKIIGSIVLHRISLNNNFAEIGYKLRPEFQQKGFMSEAISAVLNFGFDKMRLKTIEAFTHKNNIPSITLLEKHNFVFQSERRDDGFDNNRIWTLVRN